MSTIEAIQQGPKRVWVNSPSILQQHNDIHGKYGIAVHEKHEGFDCVTIYFTQGKVHSMRIDPVYLEIVKI